MQPNEDCDARSAKAASGVAEDVDIALELAPEAELIVFLLVFEIIMKDCDVKQPLHEVEGREKDKQLTPFGSQRRK
jgi:hypothetical protein